MGFSLKSITSPSTLIGGAVGGVGGAVAGSLLGGAFSPPGAPHLPGAPTLTAPQLPNYPGLTPEEQQLLQQQQGYLTGGQNALGAFQQNPYLQNQNAIGQQTSQNYLNALQGNIPPNAQLEQAKGRAWQQMVEQAGQNGIKISGNSPAGAISQSTAGNQAIADFNNSWAQQEQQYNLGQQQFGLQAYGQGLGLANQTLGAQMGAYGQLGNQASQLYQPYQQQQLGQFGVNTQQALSNSDIANQNAMNQYNASLGQTMANYQNSMMGYQTNMGLLSSVLGLGGQLGSAYLTGGASAAMPRTGAASAMGAPSSMSSAYPTIGMMNPQLASNSLSIYR